VTVKCRRQKLWVAVRSRFLAHCRSRLRRQKLELLLLTPLRKMMIFICLSWSIGCCQFRSRTITLIGSQWSVGCRMSTSGTFWTNTPSIRVISSLKIRRKRVSWLRTRSRKSSIVRLESFMSANRLLRRSKWSLRRKCSNETKRQNGLNKRNNRKNSHSSWICAQQDSSRQKTNGMMKSQNTRRSWKLKTACR